MLGSKRPYWIAMQSLSVAAILFFLMSCLFAAEPAFVPVPIPVLDSKGDVYKTEGENDPLIYDDAVGKKKLIIVYCDFDDVPMEVDTRVHGELCLGGDQFEKLFAAQSYGKLSYEITHVHGWRRLPGTSKDYDTSKTETHRDMFVKVFNLYPEVDFREYDYISAVMKRVGNTAFGEREEIAIPYRGSKIKVAMNLSSPSPHVFAHEVGHLMGLPDLYTYSWFETDEKNPAGPWDLMSSASISTGFLGWHRHKLKWLDEDRKTYLTRDVESLKLTPLHAEQGVSMVVIPVDDSAKPSKVFVIEGAQAREFKRTKRVPANGILVYSVDATIATGCNPVVVYPKQDLNQAPFHPGDTFDHEDAPFTMKVLEKAADGSYRLEIRMKQK